MARYGKLPILLPKDVKFEIANSVISIAGPKGAILRSITREVEVSEKDGSLNVSTKGLGKRGLVMQGTLRSHINNMVHGVSEGWNKKLELVGTGFRAEVKGAELHLTLGFSHPIVVSAPPGITFTIEKSIITISGVDKDVVGQTAALIRSFKEPDPYKAKGVKYVGEVIRRKAGKQAAKTTGAA